CNMNNEPVSISTLMRAVRIPMAANAPLHADRPIAMAERWGFDALASGARTFQIPRTRRQLPYVGPAETTGGRIPDIRRRAFRPGIGCRVNIIHQPAPFTSRLRVRPAALLPHHPPDPDLTRLNGSGSHPRPDWPRPHWSGRRRWRHWRR